MAVVAEKERGRSRGVDGGGNTEKPGTNPAPALGLQKQKGQFYQCDITLVCREVCPLPPHIRRWLDQNAVVLLLLNCVDVF